MLSSLGVAVLLAALLTGAEKIDPIDLDRPKRTSTERRTRDWLWFPIYLSYGIPVAIGLDILLNAITRGHPLPLARLPFGVRMIGALVVCEVVAYFVHRLMHAVPQLWRFHRVHHASTDVHWYTTFRFHPVDGTLSTSLPAVIAACLGFDRAVLSTYSALTVVITLFAHADLWFPDRWLHDVVATPNYHRAHHVAETSSTNFALVLPILDRVFRTRNPKQLART